MEKELKDIEIKEKLINREEEALEYLIDLYGGLVEFIVNKKLSSYTCFSDECINDIFLAIWNNIESFDPKISSLKNWIAGVARYKVLDYLRIIYRVEKKYIKEFDINNVNNSYIDKDLEEINKSIESELSEILVGLSCLEKKIFIKRYIEEYSIEEISEELSIPVKKIYNTIFYGKKKIRKRIGEKCNEK